MKKYDVVVVGGGIAGLTAAIYAAKAGKQTVLIEKQERVGGRATSVKKKGAYFNLGGHALYHGDALATFRELGLSLKGNQPSIDGFGIWKGKLLVLPMGMKALLTTQLFNLKGKMECASWLMKLGKLDPSRYDHISVREWIEGNLKDPMVRNFFYSLMRTASYVVAPDLQSAGPVLRQLQNSLKGVLYLDFIIAAPPSVAHQLVPNAEATALHAWKEQAIEITAACLDVALRRLPRPTQQFVYGIDQTVFLSNQSRAAYLSDDGAEVISVLKYQGEEKNPEKDLQQLEMTLDLVQPGWRNELVAKQYLPRMTVSHDFMHMKRKHIPGPAVPEIAGLYVAGEWATHGEMLVDAATASAKRAVQHILSHKGEEWKRRYEHRVIV